MRKELRAALEIFRQKRWFAPLLILVVVMVLAGALLAHLMQPERSVTAYCQVYAQERVRLNDMSNVQFTYPSATFNVSVNDAGQIAMSLGKLDQVAPKDIEPNIKTLQGLYQSVHDNPLMDAQASIVGGTIDEQLHNWTESHCSS